MNSFYERIEALLNRCGLTISDIPGDIQSEAGTAEIIDRLETALENVCGERDYLRTMARKEGCRTCIHHTYDNHLLCENEGKLCSLDDRGNCENYEYEGVPEDWSVDDD